MTKIQGAKVELITLMRPTDVYGLPFRSVLSNQNFNGIIAYSSFINPCIEASGIERNERISEGIDALDPFSDERDAFATAILGGSVQLSFDGEGRVLLPEALIAKAEIQTQAVFIGKGATFEIWSPDLYEKICKARS